MTCAETRSPFCARLTALLALIVAIGLAGCGESAPPAEAPAEPVDTSEVSSAPETDVASWPTGESSIDPGYEATPEGVAPLLEGIGPVDFPLTTEVDRARAYFNQALTFSYGFNHAEAERSFREAARLDPSCGICWWGVALVNGPNINKAMDDAQAAPAWEAVQNALANKEGASELELALIDAVATRYSEDGGDRAALDAVYAGSMRAVAEQFPDNPHVLALYAESLMDLYPWSYWNEDGSPKEHTEALVAAIERAIEIDPEHPGALHLYIHTMEQYTPEKAVSAADALGPLVPVAGHLVHMPSHIYLRVGRYHDAVLANTEASLADEDYITQCDAQGFYPAGYYPHNIHFLWYSAMMEGHKGLAVSSAQRLHEKIDLDMARQFGSIQRYLAVRAATYIRFGMWEEALAEPPAPEGMPMTTFMRDYAQGVALAATGQLDAARENLTRMQAQRDSGELDAVMDRQGDIANLLSEIAMQLVEAEIARNEANDEAEIGHLQAAIAAQDALPYTEPPFWHFPVRQALGSAYLRMGEPELAQTAFEEDLVNFPNNGWSLFGLKQALAAQGEPTDDLEQAVAQAWQYSDIEPTSGP
jgi:tetratricopeptide (TPR) repeat protein